MKFWKSGICLMMSLCLVACGPTSSSLEESSSSVEETQTETQEVIEPFYIYCNDIITKDIIDSFVAEYPEYEEKIHIVGMEEEDYAAFLANGLNDSSAEQYPDLVVLSKDLKDLYLSSEDLLSVEQLGIQEEDFANMYDYMIAYGTDEAGDVKALSWMDAASVFVYRVSLAEQYLGVTSQEEMKHAISSWVNFAETANTLSGKTDGAVRIIPELNTVKTLLYYGNDSSWYPEEGKDFVISDFLMDGIMAYQDLEENLTWNYEVGSEAWYNAMSNGSTLGFFGSSYFVETLLAENCGETAGDWEICPAPSSYELDGVWVAATKDCAEKDLAEELLRYITMEQNVLLDVMDTHHVVVNHKTLVETMSTEGSITSDILSEECQLFYYLEEVASVLNKEDILLNELFWTEAQQYWSEKLNLEQLLADIEEKIEALK